jgi:hypothetical protein
VLLAGLAVGTLDLLFACGYWGLGYGVPPTRILHSIAAGVLGAAAYQAGAAGAVLGAACHYFIATCMAGAYVLVAAREPRLLRRPVACGLAYGLLLYAAMTFVVVPLSNAPDGKSLPLSWTLSSIAMHALIGVLCAWFAPAVLRARQA